MKTRSISRKPGRGTARAALLASVAVAGGSFAIIAAAGGAASADTTTSTAPVTTVPVTTVPSPAVATTRLKHIQLLAAVAIANRVISLNDAIKSVQADTFLGSDGTTLVTNMQADIAGLTALGNKIAGDVSVQVALADYRQIFVEYRTYYFVLPDERLVVSVDRQTNVAVPAVQSQVTTLQGEITTTTPKYVADWVTNAQALLTKATTADSGLSAQLLSYTAADWNANHNLFGTAKGGTKSAARDLDRARLDVYRAERWFNHHKGTPATTTTTTQA